MKKWALSTHCSYSFECKIWRGLANLALNHCTGIFRADNFTATCPNPVENAVAVDMVWSGKSRLQEASAAADMSTNDKEATSSVSESQTAKSAAELTCAKWCPLENCTVLVLGEWESWSIAIDYSIRIVEKFLPKIDVVSEGTLHFHKGKLRYSFLTE